MYQGLLTDYYGYVTNLLRLCYGIAGSDTVKPRLHYGVNGILRLCNGSATVSTVMTRFGRLNVYISPQQSNCPSFLFYDVDEDAARGEATGGRRFAFDCSLPPVADHEENKTQEEEVCLDERLVAAQSAVRSA